VGLERGPLSLVSTIEELLGRNGSDSRLQIWEYDRWDPSRWPLDSLYPQKLALTSPTSGGRSVGIVRSRTQATEFSFLKKLHSTLRPHTVNFESRSEYSSGMSFVVILRVVCVLSAVRTTLKQKQRLSVRYTLNNLYLSTRNTQTIGMSLTRLKYCSGISFGITNPSSSGRRDMDYCWILKWQLYLI
jgi:hypothetical protein